MKKSSRKVIVLGGGLNGLLSLSYLREYFKEVVVLEAKKKSQFNPIPEKSFVFSFTRFDNPDITLRNIDVWNRIDSEEVTEEGVERYKKKIGRENETWNYTWFQNSHKGFLIENFSKDLLDHYRFNTSIEMIDPRSRILMTEKGLENYDLLINTIPAQSLVRLIIPSSLIGNISLCHKPVYMTKTKTTYLRYTDPNLFVMNVFTTDVKFYRGTINLDTIYLESLEPLDMDYLDKLGMFNLGGNTTLNHVFRPGKIFNDKIWDHYKSFLAEFNLFNIGRYAEHCSWGRVEHTVDKIKQVIRDQTGIQTI